MRIYSRHSRRSHTQSMYAIRVGAYVFDKVLERSTRPGGNNDVAVEWRLRNGHTCYFLSCQWRNNTRSSYLIIHLLFTPFPFPARYIRWQVIMLRGIILQSHWTGGVLMKLHGAPIFQGYNFVENVVRDAITGNTEFRRRQNEVCIVCCACMNNRTWWMRAVIH